MPAMLETSSSVLCPSLECLSMSLLFVWLKVLDLTCMRNWTSWLVDSSALALTSLTCILVRGSSGLSVKCWDGVVVVSGSLVLCRVRVVVFDVSLFVVLGFSEAAGSVMIIILIIILIN